MDFDKQMQEVTINGKQYALVPLCTFHDIPSVNNQFGYKFRSEVIEEQYGLRDIVYTLNLFEITDPKKIMLAKIKYGI
jgi:hypothetical protein